MYYQNPDGVSVHDGFPNPATDAALQGIDLNRLLVNHTASTFFMRIAGNAWARQGIFNNDLVIIDRAVGARPRDPIVWIHGADFMISPRHALPTDAVVWGTVTTVIHQFGAQS